MQQAQSAYQAGRLAEAGRLYQEMLRSNPRDFDALYGLGLVYLHGQQFEQAQYVLGEVVRLDPLFADGFCVRGIALVRLGRHQEGLACFEHALTIQPDSVDAWANHATALLELGQHERALVELERALAIEPTHVVSWNSRGNVLVALKRYAEAVESYDRALAIYPDFADARQNRLLALGELNRGGPQFAETLCAQGSELMQRGRWQEALRCFDEALTTRPDLVFAAVGRATALLEMKRPDEALAGFDLVVQRDPKNAIGWNNRGNALAVAGRLHEAIESYSRALEIEPGLQMAIDNRENALFQLRRLTRCPPGFMRKLFDDFSAHYDDTMLAKLEYRAHLNLRDFAGRVLPPPAMPRRILDLGCGTGLVARAFSDFARGGPIDGIDLSPRMIETARTFGIYRDLILGDLETELASPGPQYDLILAADTMIYLGDLSRCFAGVERRLDADGHYLFAAESMPGEGWQQTPGNRFRHSESYLRAEAARAGLEFVDIEPCTLRTESSVPVGGFVVALRKTG